MSFLTTYRVPVTHTDAKSLRPYFVGRNGRVPRADIRVLGLLDKMNCGKSVDGDGGVDEP